jgi:translation initiation factor IF-1
MRHLTTSLPLVVICSALLAGCGKAETYAKNYDEENGNTVSVALVNGKDATGYILGNGRMEISGHVISVANGTAKIDGSEVMKITEGDRVDMTSSKDSLTLTSGDQHATRSL